jgi:hypothetical protein
MFTLTNRQIGKNNNFTLLFSTLVGTFNDDCIIIFVQTKLRKISKFLKIQDRVRQITTQGENKYRIEQKKGSQKMVR